jgi:hypothetical protein
MYFQAVRGVRTTKHDSGGGHLPDQTDETNAPAAAPEPDQTDDNHEGVPRDADGVPIWFRLPPDIRAKYGRKLERCRVRWRATHDPAFVVEALILSLLHRQPQELWLTEAACDLALKGRTKGYRTRAYNALKRLMRYRAVRDAKPNRTWEEAYDRAAEDLAKTTAKGEPDTMRDDYFKVAKDLREGRGGLYGMPKLPNKRLSDAVGRR